jgi:hypothetical protein
MAICRCLCYLANSFQPQRRSTMKKSLVRIVSGCYALWIIQDEGSLLQELQGGLIMYVEIVLTLLNLSSIKRHGGRLTFGKMLPITTLGNPLIFALRLEVTRPLTFFTSDLSYWLDFTFCSPSQLHRRLDIPSHRVH